MDTPTNLPHGHVTLLFTDVEDSTPMNRALGNELYRQQMQNPLFERLTACITEQHGHLSGTPAGDSLFAVFQEPDQGLACARAMQERVSQSPITFTHEGKEWQMKVRIGVHTAERQMFADDAGLYHGEDVNFASRVMSQGKGGQVLASARCHHAAGGQQGYTFHAWEGRLLKGIPHPTTLYELLWAQGQKALEPGTRWLPAWMRKYSDAFIGREDLLSQIETWVRGETPMLVLHGPGGIGKTRLAVQALLRMIDLFEGEVYGVALDEEFGSNPATVRPEQLAAAIARAVDAPREVLDAPLQKLAAFLEAGKPAIVLLDNGESALNTQTTEWLGTFLWNLKKVRWLVSSRFDPGLEPLTQTLTVSRLSLPREEAKLPDEDSYRLFKARVESRQPPLDISDTASLLRILRSTAGFPLAIELVATQRHFRTLKEIANGLDKSLLDWQRVRQQAGQRRGDSDRHQSMEACIHWSVQMQPIDEQRLYARLGIFAFDFDAEAAREIAEIPESSLDIWQVANLIERLEQNQTTRYRLLPVFREYATRRQQQDWPDDTGVLSQRYVRYYARLIYANANINIPTQKAVLDAEWRSALDATEIAARIEEGDTLTSLAYSLRNYLQISIYGTEAIRLQELALQTVRNLKDLHGEANGIRRLGDLALARSDHETARQRYEEALTLFRQVGDVLGEANCIQGLGDIALRHSEHEAARHRFEAALPLHRQIGDVLGEANCIQGLGDIALRHSEHEAARHRFEAALPLHRQIGDVLGEANCIRSLGDIALERSDHEAAHQRYEEALTLFRQIGEVMGEANCIQRLGDIALERSDHEAARQRYEEALTLFRQVGAVSGEANSIFSLGNIAIRRSDHETARQRYEEALPLYRQVGAVLGEANCIRGLGEIALRHSDHEAARQRFEQALMLYRQIPESYSIGVAHCMLAYVARDEVERMEHVQAARAAWTSIGFDHMLKRLDAEFGAEA